MITYSSKKLLEGLSDHTEAFLQKATSEWQMTAHATFTKQPAAGSWSANQCIAHLNEYGRYYLPAIENAINAALTAQSAPASLFRPGWLGNYFTEMMLTDLKGSPKKKMTAPKAYSPANTADSAMVVAEFIDQQEKLLLLLRKASQVNLNGSRIPISIAKFIRLKLGDVFLFLIAHNYRHIMQAQRALGVTQNTLPPFSLHSLQ